MKTNRPAYDACLFDFDYTLGDSTAGIVLCANGALEEMGYPSRGVEAIRRTVGLSLPETFTQLTGESDAALCGRFSALFKRRADGCMTENTVLYPDTIGVLRWLKENGVRTGVVTTKLHYRIDEILAKFHIPHLVGIIIGAEDVARAKPDPEGLLAAIRGLGAARERALYIGDSVVDARAARDARVDFAAVTTGATPREAFLEYPNRAVMDSLSALAGIVTP